MTETQLQNLYCSKKAIQPNLHVILSLGISPTVNLSIVSHLCRSDENLYIIPYRNYFLRMFLYEIIISSQKISLTEN
jgi:hypothetical protein